MKRGLGMQALEMEVRVSEKGTQGRQAGLACRLSTPHSEIKSMTRN